MFKWIKDLFIKPEGNNPPEIAPPRPLPTNTSGVVSVDLPNTEPPRSSSPPPKVPKVTYPESDYKDWSRDVVKVEKDRPLLIPNDLDSRDKIFEDFYQTLREHQKDAYHSQHTEDIGQLILPTGTGKTKVQIAIHVDQMIDNELYYDPPTVHVIAAHRLVLCAQLLNELVDLAVKCRLAFNILLVGSDRVDESEFHKKFYGHKLDKSNLEAISSTSTEDIKSFVEKSKEQGRNVICVSTYHSFHKLKDVKVDLATFDEAHVLVNSSDNFLSNIAEVNITRKFFFTATRKVINEEFGMNDERIFGPVLYEVSPREMIDKGEIVAPKLHIIRPLGEGDWNNDSMLVKSITDGFTQHTAFVKKYSYDPSLIGPKLLVTTTGAKELMEIVKSEVFSDYCYKNSIWVLGFSSTAGYYLQVPGDKKVRSVSRQELTTVMNTLRPLDEAILLHIDILTEGIDLPGITGVMPFRELNKTKLLQTIGRAARLVPADRERLYRNTIGPKELSYFVKPYSWILIPEFFRSLGNSEQMISTLTTIFNSYAVPVEEYIVPDRFLANKIPDLDNITSLEDLRKKLSECDLDHTIQSILMDALETAFHNEEFQDVLEKFIHEQP